MNGKGEDETISITIPPVSLGRESTHGVRDSLCILEGDPVAIIKGISRQSNKCEDPESTVIGTKGPSVAHDLVR